jgi:hypothetical protein
MARKLTLNTAFCMQTGAPWDAEGALANALAERALFLKNHPRHVKFQAQIDRMLDKAGNAEGRMTVLAMMIEAKLIELNSNLKLLNTILLRAVSSN